MSQQELVHEKSNPIIAPHKLSAAIYFTYFMAFGCFMPFISLYYDRLGMTGVQIGRLTAVPVLVSSSTVLIWASIADRYQLHRRILQVSFLLGAVAVFLLSTVGTFQMLLIYVISFAFFTSATVPLLDSAALEAAENSGRTYGELRLWGSVGWSIATIVLGWIIQQTSIDWMFYGYIVVILVTFVLSLFQSKRLELPKTSLRSGYKQLLLNGPFLLFLLSIFLLALSLSASNNFFSIYLDSIGTAESGIGLAWAIASMSEIPVMLFSGRIIKRIGAKGLLIIAFSLFGLRLLIFSFTTTPFLAISLQLLAGVSFGLYLVGAVAYVKERTPVGLSTSGQSIFNMVGFGIGSIVGPLIAGYIYDEAGISWLFRLLSVIVLVGLTLFLVSQRKE